jgi:hypothetical protein
MSVVLVVLMAAVAVWLLFALRAQRRGRVDATADFSRARAALAPARAGRRRRSR